MCSAVCVGCGVCACVCLCVSLSLCVRVPVCDSQWRAVCVQDIARALRNENKEHCEIQRELGKRDIIQTDLIPILIQCEASHDPRVDP